MPVAEQKKNANENQLPAADIEKEGEDNEKLFEPSRISIDLTPDNIKFIRSPGNLISIDFINHKGEKEFLERIVIFRSFPITNPNEFLSVREPDSKKMGRGKEIGMIRRLSDFDPETQSLINEELERRYFSPTILKIRSIKEKFGYTYWDAETTSGNVTFILNNPFSNIRILEDGRIFISDMDGNNFQIPDPKKLDAASYKKIEIYL